MENHSKIFATERLKHLLHSYWCLPFIVNDNREFSILIWLMSSQQAIKIQFSWEMSSLTQTKSVRHTENSLLSFFRTPLTSTNLVTVDPEVVKLKLLKTEISFSFTKTCSHRAVKMLPFFKATRWPPCLCFLNFVSMHHTHPRPGLLNGHKSLEQ